MSLKPLVACLGVVIGLLLSCSVEARQNMSSPSGEGEGGSPPPGLTNDDGGDTPSLPNIPYDYVGYAVTNLPSHYTGVANGNLPPNENTPANNPITNAGATLGRVLFYDVRLSHNDTISCASCHQQELGFSDARKFSVGADGRTTHRHSMGLSNAKFYQNGKFRWDQTADTLEEQNLLPIEHPDEMNLDLGTLVTKLEGTSFYADLFNDAFGDPAITSDRVALSLAQFIRSMVSYNSKFDLAYTTGSNGMPDFAGVFTQQEQEGLALFGGQTGTGNELMCFRCHETVGHVAREPFNSGLDVDTTADEGAGLGRFKTPSLRNVAVLNGYMHDGRFKTLTEVVEFYNSGVQPHANLHPFLQKPNGDPIRLNLTQTQKDALVAFLETLTDDTFLTSPLFSDPFPINLPEVDSVEVNDATGQRSAVDSITIKLDGVIDIEPDAFSVIQRSDAGGSTGTAVTTSFSTSVIAGQTVAVVSFGSLTRNATGVLEDGNYQLTIDGSKVFRDGRPMAEDFVFGDVEADAFYTFFGDSDGDRDVDAPDLSEFWQTYRKSSGDSGFNPTLDFDADGDVDNVDFGQFIQRFSSNFLPFN
ncbi:MAG: cytochrome-c peroxidase [Mariniblastus sp.]